jgi:F-type H+-transporting ATPase subunit b
MMGKGNCMASKRIAIMTTLLWVATATLAFAASGGGHEVDSGVVFKDFLWRCLNFAILFGALAYVVSKPVRNALTARREGVEKALADAETAKSEAEARFAEYDEKLSRAAAEIAEITAGIRREGELERDRILANAREMADKIQREAERAAENEIVRARTELRREAARLAIGLAEELLKKNFTGEDHDRLVNEYMQKVGELH